MNFHKAWDLQRQLVEDRAADRCPDTMILLEHQPVFTVGRSGRPAHCLAGEEALAERGFPVYHIERGGSITYHGPGQLVGYPILRLRSFCAGPKAYMRQLEDVIIRVLAEWGLTGRRLEKLPGVWIGKGRPEKIASMGVRISNGVTMHGFALNVALDLEPFSYIVPCGLPDCPVTSMTKALGRAVDVHEVRSSLTQAFAQVFDLTWSRRITGDSPEAASLLNDRNVNDSATSEESPSGDSIRPTCLATL